MGKFPKFDIISLTGSSVQGSYLVVSSLIAVLKVTIKIFTTQIFRRISRGEIAICQFPKTKINLVVLTRQYCLFCSIKS